MWLFLPPGRVIAANNLIFYIYLNDVQDQTNFMKVVLK